MMFVTYPEETVAYYGDHDDDGPGCPAAARGWFCTRTAKHDHDHEAVGLANEFCARWSVDESD